MRSSRASRSGPRCRHVFALVAVMLFVCAHVNAQTGAVTLTATVSETVALSLPPNFTLSNINSNVVSSGNTMRLTLSSTSHEPPVIRVPLLVRSNCDFKISVEGNAPISELSVVRVRATGNLVSPAAVNSVNENTGSTSQPMLLTGPRVSLGGTLNSLNNALEVTVLIRLQPQPNRDWSFQLTFVGEPE